MREWKTLSFPRRRESTAPQERVSEFYLNMKAVIGKICFSAPFIQRLPVYAGMTILLLAMPIKSEASELTALQLQEYCGETDKGLLGEKFDSQKSEICKGYIMGFFDSMIISDQFARKPQFCVPASLPKTNNSLILNAWIKQNQKIAETTTAAVALFSAYTKAFPCK